MCLRIIFETHQMVMAAVHHQAFSDAVAGAQDLVQRRSVASGERRWVRA